MIKKAQIKIIKISILLLKSLKIIKNHIKFKKQGKKWIWKSLKKICKMKFKAKKKNLKINNFNQKREEYLKMKVLVGI